MKTIAFFNNKGGVGKTSLVYHLAWMYAELGKRVVAADLDPQANLTSMFVDEDRLEELWSGSERLTVYGAIRPVLVGNGDVRSPCLQSPDPSLDLDLVVGDLRLAKAEAAMATEWPACMDGHERAFRVLSVLGRLLQRASEETRADVILVDVGPSLGALNRAALIAADYVVVPLAPDLYSLQGLRNLGPTLRDWRRQWSERRVRNPAEDLRIPKGAMHPIGYVVMQHAVRLDRPVKAYARWIDRIPGAYSHAVCDTDVPATMSIDSDPNCLASLKHFRSLMPLAQEARKPMFALRPADGAIGGHTRAVQECYRDFRELAQTIDQRSKV